MKASAKGGPIPVQNISLPFFIFFGANRWHFSAIFGTETENYPQCKIKNIDDMVFFQTAMIPFIFRDVKDTQSL